MRVSVIIPLYLGRDVICQCLQSVLKSQIEFELQVIVVDDASPDGAGAMVGSEFSDVEIITNRKNLGYAASVNRGLLAADGDFLFLLNQDTELQRDTITILVNKLTQNSELTAVAPRLLKPDGTVQKSCRTLPRHSDVIYHHLLLSYLFPRSDRFSRWKMGWFSHDKDTIVEQPYFSAIMFRRDVIDRIGELDIRFRLLFNDVDYCKRIADSGGKILFTPDTSVMHIGGQALRQVPFRKTLHSHCGFVKYFFKHYRGVRYLLPNMLIALLLTLSGVLRCAWLAVLHPITNLLQKTG
jgi:GT2 family glycosyltransferase